MTRLQAVESKRNQLCVLVVAAIWAVCAISCGGEPLDRTGFSTEREFGFDRYNFAEEIDYIETLRVDRGSGFTETGVIYGLPITRYVDLSPENIGNVTEETQFACKDKLYNDVNNNFAQCTLIAEGVLSATNATVAIRDDVCIANVTFDCQAPRQLTSTIYSAGKPCAKENLPCRFSKFIALSKRFTGEIPEDLYGPNSVIAIPQSGVLIEVDERYTSFLGDDISNAFGMIDNMEEAIYVAEKSFGMKAVGHRKSDEGYEVLLTSNPCVDERIERLVEVFPNKEIETIQEVNLGKTCP